MVGVDGEGAIRLAAPLAGAKKEVAMSSSGKPFTTITLEDGTFGVVRTDPRKPQFLEVIAIFSDVSRARSCAEKENGWSGEQVIAFPEARPTEVMPELSPRQRAYSAGGKR
jgi:hypothetical protein